MRSHHRTTQTLTIDPKCGYTSTDNTFQNQIRINRNIRLKASVRK